MSLTRLTCPECETVMRPKVPVAPGKKVKCPKCEHVFVARGDVDEVDEVEDVDEVEEAPKKKPKAKEKPKPAKEQKEAPKKEEEEAYGVIKDEAPPKPAKPKKKKKRDEDDEDDDEDEEEEEDDGKPKINYGLDESIRDLRGPAIEKLREPATWLTFSGLVGVVGWLAFIVILIIPFAFPIIEDEKKPDKFAPPPKKKDDGKTPAKKVNKFLVVWQTFDFNEVVEQPPALFWLIMAGFFLLGLYSGLIAFGGIKFLNLESRPWGIAAGIMALLPVSPAGLVFTLAFFVQWLLRQVELDDGTDIYITGGLGVLLYLASIGLGVWTLIVANDEVVKTGYEYKGE